jgi:molybdenum cofactor cytidylyltransferase
VEAVADAIKALTAAGCDLVMALGASAIMDRRDVVPQALRRVGGEVTRFGMPVDPGNLLMLGTIGDATFIGLPGCARSLARSGFDWVLERVVAGLPIAAGNIAKLGVGGLLDEAARPTPRDAKDRGARTGIAAVVLAAGKSSRMGENKLLALLDGKPLVHHAVSAALASSARPVVVVTGNDADRVREALDGRRRRARVPGRHAPRDGGPSRDAHRGVRSRER